MKIEKFKSEALGDEIIRATHPSGLKVYICEKPEYKTVNALFGTHYGSIDTRFKTDGSKEFTEIPEGTAHFLEHKLFESEDGGVFQKYAKTGAQANAYTSFDRTCYLFVSTARHMENLNILLDFVRHPYLTPENVEKEKGIIGQEIKMYDDVPSWRLLFNLLTCLYHNHPVRIDIAGTVESIAEIDCDMLYNCYNTFYNLSNMFICVAGDIKADEVLAAVEKMAEGAEGVNVTRGEYNEPDSVVKTYVEQSLPVSMPMFSIGFKESHDTPLVSQREIVLTNILLSVIAGHSSDFFNRMLSEGKINDSFEYEYFCGYGYYSIIFSGESHCPQYVYDELKKEIEKFKQSGISKDEFERVVKKYYGSVIADTYNDIENIAGRLVETAMNDYEPFSDLDIFANITVDEANELLKNKFDFDRCAMSVINPVEEVE